MGASPHSWIQVQPEPAVVLQMWERGHMDRMPWMTGWSMVLWTLIAALLLVALVLAIVLMAQQLSRRRV